MSCELVEGFERNIARPGDFRDFQKKLDKLCAGRNVQVRLVWAPEINRHELEPPDFKPIRGKQYAVMIVREHIGWRVYVEGPGKGVIVKGENWKFIRYERPWRLHSTNDSEVLIERDGRKLNKPELWIKDKKSEQVAYPRWVIEQRLHDEIEKPKWEAERIEWMCLLKVDWLGEYPKEGLWRALHVICEHDEVCCSEHADSLGFCYGRYRAPAFKDLVAVEEALLARENENYIHSLFDPPSLEEIAEKVRQTLGEIAEGEQRAKDQMREIILNEITPTLNAHLFPSVDLGSQNTLDRSQRTNVPRLVLTEAEIRARQAKDASIELAGE